MKREVKKDYVRVIPQFTIKPNTVRLVSEENHKHFKKGSLVLQCSRETIYSMHRPLCCEVRIKKVKGQIKISPKIVLKGEYESPETKTT